MRAKVSMYILVLLFGVSSWVDINGLWVELPILVQELPEGWNLPSYIVVIIQLANLGPIIYGAVFAKRVPERGAIYVIISICAATSLLLVFFWRETSLVAGELHSTALLTLNFILALVDCTSTVVFYPFMATLKPAYMIAYFTGEGFGGLFSGLLGLAQGAGKVICQNVTNYNNDTENTAMYTWNATQNTTIYTGTSSLNSSTSLIVTYGENNFSFETFFSIITACIVMSGIAFTILTFHPACKSEHMPKEKAKGEEKEKMDTLTKEVPYDTDHEVGDMALNEMEIPLHVDEVKAVDKGAQESQENGEQELSRMQTVAALLLTGLVNCLKNSALPAIQSFSCLPYGTTQFHLVVTLSNLANPAACFVDLFYNVTSLPVLFLLAMTSCMLGAYIIVAAAMSPAPVLVGTLSGSILIVVVWVLCSGLLSYVKVALATLFRVKGKTGLLHCGVATQIGSGIGGLLMFIFVNIFGFFRSIEHCST